MSVHPDLRTVKRRLLVSVVATLALLATSAIATDAARAGSSGGVGGGIPTDDGSATNDGSATGDGFATGDDSSDRVTAKYERLWDRVPRRDKRWAHRTSECESGSDPDAIGGGGRYRGAFQFTRSTWRNSPKTPGGDPIDYTYRTQAVVAVALMRRDGAGHWPNCG